MDLGVTNFFRSCPHRTDRFHAEPVLSMGTRFLTDPALSRIDRFLAALEMTSEGLGMTVNGEVEMT